MKSSSDPQKQILDATPSSLSTQRRNRWTRRRFMQLSGLAAAQLMVGCSSDVLATSTQSVDDFQKRSQKRIQSSPQFKDGKFHNPIDVPMMAEGKTWDYVKRQFFSSRVDPEPKGEIPMKRLQRENWMNPNRNDPVFSWLGHSSILIALDGKTMLIDPVLEERASPFSFVGPQRFHPAPVAVPELPEIDVVLITHDHYDHLEEPTMKQLAKKAGIFVVPLGIGGLLAEWGIPIEKIIELDWWEDHPVDSLNITLTPALHYARRGVFDGDERLWCSFCVQGATKNLFISGDSGYFDEFQKIGQKLGPFDMTFLKIGSYDETWKQIHMTAEEAVQQHLDVRGGVMVPLHWATFDLGLHPWYEPIERMLISAQEKEVRFFTPKVGHQINFNNMPAVETWWRNVAS